MINIKSSTAFERLSDYLKKVSQGIEYSKLDRIGHEGVRALSEATPVDTGETASKWRYVIEKEDGKLTIHFLNDNIVKGVPIAIILQYGHATRGGGYYRGVDYINPALGPIFKELTDEALEVIKR